MRKLLFPLLLAMALCVSPVLTGAASAADGPITVWGLVVNTNFGLVIKNGDTEYLLLGVSQDPGTLEGRTCEVTGTASNSLGIDTINVDSIQVVGDTSSMNYTSMNAQPGGRTDRLA
ncbi:hypothetical protein LF599_03870 [Pseudodesulfovibrio thermohalotolerans]|uniref:hypothetical protein n=1 Tax=Pseudodesulfovibrio thermohalotolerans TaxID=2880651 RepID=UPI0022B9D5AC|nr:hypothetical protein [Pseudodesulfovibrio thermohalotolerans]WFS63315.1 hypothetical protein LF599_03870 [Pseudodesulfovibrio thermohalotolerans]